MALALQQRPAAGNRFRQACGFVALNEELARQSRISALSGISASQARKSRKFAMRY
jgi:hypothetical protein